MMQEDRHRAIFIDVKVITTSIQDQSQLNPFRNGTDLYETSLNNHCRIGSSLVIPMLRTTRSHRLHHLTKNLAVMKLFQGKTEAILGVGNQIRVIIQPTGAK